MNKFLDWLFHDKLEFPRMVLHEEKPINKTRDELGRVNWTVVQKSNQYLLLRSESDCHLSLSDFDNLYPLVHVQNICYSTIGNYYEILVMHQAIFWLDGMSLHIGDIWNYSKIM